MTDTAPTTSERLRLAVLTTSRADFGIYQSVLAELKHSARIEAGLLVSGMHLSADFGMTVNEVRSSGHAIWGEAPCLTASDKPEDIAASCGQAVRSIAQALAKSAPDMVMVLGDRYEMMAGAIAASIMNMSIAHIHGGEETRGAYDNAFRHAITKLSHLHFTATPLAAQRVVQMGEPADRVFCCGAPALDTLATLELVERGAFLQQSGLRDAPFLLVTYHPETLSLDSMESTLDALWRALEQTGLQFLITAANADTMGRSLNQMIERRCAALDRAVFVRSLGLRLYATAMRHAAAMVGNSSSGIIEAAHFKLPVVNIGDRQAGRERAGNVIDATAEFTAIQDALAKAMSRTFRSSLAGVRNPYGTGRAAACIRAALERIDTPRKLLVKAFAPTPAGTPS